MTSLQLDDGKMIAANKYGQTSEEQQELELTEDEVKIKENISLKHKICNHMTSKKTPLHHSKIFVISK